MASYSALLASMHGISLRRRLAPFSTRGGELLPASLLNARRGTSSFSPSPASGSRDEAVASPLPLRSPSAIKSMTYREQVVADTPLYRTFMGVSTVYAQRATPLTREDIQKLELEKLTHVVPSCFGDHVAIKATKALRWVADRLYRDRYMHRATMLSTIACSPAAAGAFVLLVRLALMRGTAPVSSHPPPSPATHPSSSSKLENPSPPQEKRTTAAASAAGNDERDEEEDASILGTGMEEGRKPLLRRRGYVEEADPILEYRGLSAQAESHTCHYAMLVEMSQITTIERLAVVGMQVFQFCIFTVLFTASPRFALRLMGYMREEATVLWTHMINDVDVGKVVERDVPPLALSYWNLEGFQIEHKVTSKRAVGGGLKDAQSHEMQEMNGEGTPVVTARTPPQGESESVPENPLREEGEEGENETNPETSINSDNEKNVLTLRDVLLLIRSDEMLWRDLDHKAADIITENKRKKHSIWYSTFLN